MIRRALSLALVAVTVAVLTACAPNGGGKHADAGVIRWRWRPPPPASIGMPVADANGVFATFGHLFLVGLAPDGTERWRTRRLGVREETPLLTPELAVVPADDGLVAFERTTGHVRWDAHLGGNVQAPNPDDAASTPIVAGSSVLSCLSGGALVAVDAGSGAVRWRVPLAGRCDGPPATDGHTVVATWDPEHGDGAGIAAFDAATGTRRWTAPLRAGGVSAPAVLDTGGRRLAVTVDHDLAAKAYDLDTGRRVWTAHVGGAGAPEVPPLPLAGRRVLVADRDADLAILDAEGKRTWSSASAGAAVRGAPSGPTRAGAYALVLDDGTVQLSGPGKSRRKMKAPGGLANGVTVAPTGTLFVSSAQGDDNQLVAYGPPTT